MPRHEPDIDAVPGKPILRRNSPMEYLKVREEPKTSTKGGSDEKRRRLKNHPKWPKNVPRGIDAACFALSIALGLAALRAAEVCDLLFEGRSIDDVMRYWAYAAKGD